MLQTTFAQLLEHYTSDKELIINLWKDLEKHHSEPHRHYHILKHLEHLLQELVLVKDNIGNWHTVLFTLFYHDAIYDPLKSDNEEKSAGLTKRRLEKLVPAPALEACIQQILATKKHLPADNDTNYFTDADLSILGQDWQQYQTYAANIRKEYDIYPDMLYKPGRRKVLKHFLAMERIYKTSYFYDKYEQAARMNLQKELEGFK